MKTMILFILTISLSMCMSCCSSLFSDEKLSMKRVDYHGNELKIDGYYYHYHQEPESTQILFLYRNGVLLLTRFFPSHDLDYVEKTMLTEYDKIREDKIRWGVFLILDDRIEYEKWNGSTGIGLPIIKRKGIIENDTTFRIIETYFSDSKETDYKELIYHFKQFSPKPDSTNVYIKSPSIEDISPQK